MTTLRTSICAVLAGVLLFTTAAARSQDADKLRREVEDLKSQLKEERARHEEEKQELQAEIRKLKDRIDALDHYYDLVPERKHERIAGQVLGVDEKGLVRISIGSDSGLKEGQELIVYRLAPEPKYLGTLTIFKIMPKESVGRFSPATRGVKLPETGDKVEPQFDGPDVKRLRREINDGEEARRRLREADVEKRRRLKEAEDELRKLEDWFRPQFRPLPRTSPPFRGTIL